ncbi:MAG TPA: DUF2285 domain-containing protein [Sphingomicrobium sp.]|nr:DUF2285 domain-containing protein [Sphingomicrobium sp.]
MGEWSAALRSAWLRLVDRAFDMGFDWRDPKRYACLLDADRSLFAWEWLRRNSAYRAAARNARHGIGAFGDCAAERFGLVRFEDAEASVPRARPLWRSDINPQVLVADFSRESREETGFELDRFRHLAHLVSERETDHLLLTDGLRAIRLDAPRGAFETRDMRLRFRIGAVPLSEFSVLALRRFLALARRGRFARSLHRPEPRAPRWILQLRAHDGLEAGADLREIAEELLGRSTAETRWRTRDPSLRSQAQRVVRSARVLANGGFRQLLGA